MLQTYLRQEETKCVPPYCSSTNSSTETVDCMVLLASPILQLLHNSISEKDINLNSSRANYTAQPIRPVERYIDMYTAPPLDRSQIRKHQQTYFAYLVLSSSTLLIRYRHPVAVYRIIDPTQHPITAHQGTKLFQTLLRWHLDKRSETVRGHSGASHR